MNQSALVRLVLPDVRELLHEAKKEDIARALRPFHAADVAELVERLEDGDAATLVGALADGKRAEVFEQLETPQCARLVNLLGPEVLAPTIVRMASDDRADLVAALTPEVGQKLLALLPADERQDVAELTKYPAGTAGAIMTSDHVGLKPAETVKDAIDHIRQVARRRETIYALYVVDEHEHLLGAVSLETLLLSASEKTMMDIMLAPISVKVDADQESVVATLRHYDFLAVPVVDAQGKLLGIVTHDDALDVATQEATEDAQKMGGMAPLAASYFDTSFPRLIRARAVWLSVLFFTELIGGMVLKGQEEVLHRVLPLVFFLPLITASGGNSGAQAATLVTRGLAVGDIRTDDVWRILRRELAAGATLGTLLGVYAIIVAWVWGIESFGGVATTVWVTLLCVVTAGSLLGSLMPVFMARIGIDPAVTSSPLVTCLVDVLGIVILTTVASIVVL